MPGTWLGRGRRMEGVWTAPVGLLVVSWVATFAICVTADFLSNSVEHDFVYKSVSGNVTEDSGCHCQDTSLCKPLQVGPRQEVLGFSTHPTLWKYYDWSKITTIAVFRTRDNQWDDDILEMYCAAHSNNVRVVIMGFYDVANLSRPDLVQSWVEEMVALTEKYNADGINIDIEEPLRGVAANKQLVDLVQMTKTAFHERFPHSQVTFDVAWSPDCVDRRCYDAKGLANATDFLVLMSYDEQGQIFYPQPCVAGANSGLQQTIDGVNGYLALGIESSKLVLGQPWYGYDYVCVTTPPLASAPGSDMAESSAAAVGATAAGGGLALRSEVNPVCYMKEVPYQGAYCSDAAGSQREYRWVMRALRDNATTRRLWDSSAQAPYFDFRDEHGLRHQVWYDDPVSLILKYELVQKMSLRGIALWGTDFLDYTGDPVERAQATEMWDVINVKL